jgi:hypothetical protein
MLGKEKIEDIAATAARMSLPPGAFERVIVEPAIDSLGNDALRITIVLQADSVRKISGESALNLSLKLNDAMEDEGDVRLPIVEYATEEELIYDDSQEEA